MTEEEGKTIVKHYIKERRRGYGWWIFSQRPIKLEFSKSQRFPVPFTYPEDPNNPYYDLVFHTGKVFLTDDSDTSFADGSEGMVKIIREYDLPDIRFDGKAKRIKQ